MSRHRIPIIEDAAAACGGIRQLAERLNVTYQAIWKWRRIPADRVIDIERITGIPRERLRPDLFGAPRPRPLRRRPTVSVAA